MIIFSLIVSRLCSFEKHFNWSFIEKRHVENSEYIECTAIKLKVMFDKCQGNNLRSL